MRISATYLKQKKERFALLTITRSSKMLLSSPEIETPIPMIPSTVVQPSSERVVISPNVAVAVSPPTVNVSTESFPKKTKQNKTKITS